MPPLAMAPPRMAVRRSPKESIRIPASGEMKNVMPMESDPTRAKYATIVRLKRGHQQEEAQEAQEAQEELLGALTCFGGGVSDVRFLQLILQLQVDDAVAVVDAEDQTVG